MNLKSINYNTNKINNFNNKFNWINRNNQYKK